MVDKTAHSVLSRMTRHSRATPAHDRGMGARRAFQRALRRAGAPFAGLLPEPRKDEVSWSLPVGDLLTSLPEGGLLVGLDAPGGHRGLCLLDQPTVDALIEVQTTGRVDAVVGPPRKATKIDIALTRDFIDLLLSAFAAELDGAVSIDWPKRMSFGGALPDRRQLPMLMPDADYHLFTCHIDLGGGIKEGTIGLAVPSIHAETKSARHGAKAPDPAWRKAIYQAVSAAQVELGATLLRTRRTLAELDRLAPGDLIIFDRADLARVALEDRNGRPVLRGRLGQQGGARALSLVGGEPAKEDTATQITTKPAVAPNLATGSGQEHATAVSKADHPSM